MGCPLSSRSEGRGGRNPIAAAELAVPLVLEFVVLGLELGFAMAAVLMVKLLAMREELEVGGTEVELEVGLGL